MRDINCFWIGPELGPVHTACLRSFLRCGYRVILHVFDPPKDVPTGVELFDASKLMKPSEAIPYEKSGSYSFAANIYRYRILKAGMGVYVDCDVFCLKPLPEMNYILGWQSHKSINCAVLGAPAKSDFVEQLFTLANDSTFIPPWFKTKEQRKLRLKKALGLPEHPSTMPWGTIGPALVTHLVKNLGLEDKVLPIDAFYPLHWDHTPLLNEPGISIDDLCTSRTHALHLFNHFISWKEIRAGSVLSQVVES